MKILPVNRNFYWFAIFFFVLLTAVTLFESTLRFALKGMVFTLDSYLNWFLTYSAITIATSLLLLTYYYHKKYQLTFFAGLTDLLANFLFSFIIYHVLKGELKNYYLPFLIVTFITGIPYFISLIVSPAGRRPWLRIAGIFVLILKLVFASLFVWSMTSPDVHRFETAEKINQWILLGSSFIPLPFIMNFLNELKTLKVEPVETAQQPVMEAATGIAGLVLFIAAILIGGKINTEKYWLAQWVNRGPENAQRLAELFDARTYVNNKRDTLKYRLLMPLHYDSTQNYPLVVCLHGGGGRGTDNMTQIEGSWMAQLLSKYQNREKYPAFIFVPQCSPAASWGGIPGLSVVDSIVFDAIGELEKEFDIDTKRRYVMGESLGGYGSWHFITARPEMFAAAVPICGGGDPALAPAIVNVPVWAFHGAEDRNVPVRLSRDMIEAIKTAGGDPKYTEYPDEGHIISEQVIATPNLLDWVFAQRRD